MSLWYVRKSGNDSHAGTSPSTAFLTCGKAATSVAAGDTVYVGGGGSGATAQYRELLQLSTSGSGGSVITWIADVDGANTGDSGEVQITAYTTNDTTNPSSTRATIDLHNKSYNTFHGFTVIGANANPSCVNKDSSATNTNTNCTFTDCVFIPGDYLQSIGLTTTANVTMAFLFDRCSFGNLGTLGSSQPFINVTAPVSASADYDVGLTVQNCVAIAPSCFINMTVTGSPPARPGGVTVLNCTIVGGSGYGFVVPPNWSQMYPFKIINCLVQGSFSGFALSATVYGSVIEEDNVWYAPSGSGVNNTNVGNKSIGNAGNVFNRALLWDIGQSVKVGAALRPMFTPAAISPMLGWSSAQIAVGIPGTAADDSAVGTVSWTNPNNALIRQEVAGEAYATAVSLPITTGQSHYLDISNFGFSIPTDATITGVLAQWWAKTAGGTVKVASVKLLKAGSVSGSDQSANVTSQGVGSNPNLTTSDKNNYYGGDGLLWGATLAPSDVNNSGFGVAVSFINSTGSTETVSVDYVSVTVYYTEPQMPNNDFLNRPRPAGGNILAAIGALERHDMGIVDTGTTDGAGNDSIKLTGYDDHELYINVDATATTLTIDSQYDAGYAGTNYPQVTLTNGGECGVADQTQTNAGGGSAAWTTLTFSFTPTSAGVVTLRLISRSTSASGHAWFAKPSY